MSENQIGGLSFMGVGGLLLLIALFFLIRTRRFLREATTVQGAVSSLVAGSGSEGGTVYYPVVRFTTIEGQEIEFRDKMGSNPPRHQPGDIVDVKYLPSNPHKARLSGKLSLWFVPGLLGFLGTVFLAAGVPWYQSTDADDAASADAPPAVASLDPGLPSPGDVPVAGPVLSVRTAEGSALIEGACEEIGSRRSGRVREVRLGMPDFGSLVITARPYSGAGAYIPGQNVRVAGSFFEQADGELTGAVVFDDTESSGVVNLVRGDRSVSGQWDCAGAGG